MKCIYGWGVLALFLIVGLTAAAFAFTDHSEKSFIVIGHRGAAAHAPENTMASFRKAYEMRADLIELDIHKTLDGHLVVMHDDKVNRTTDGSGKIHEMTLEQIRSLDAGSWFNEVFKGEPVPTLEEVLEWARNRVPLNIEIKGAGCEEKLVELLHQYQMESQVLVISFNHQYLAKIRKLAPEVKVGALVRELGNVQNIVKTCNPNTLHPWYRFLSAKEIQQAHSAGLLVHTYTVDSEDDMIRMLERGVDGIVTDYPDRAIALREAGWRPSVLPPLEN